MNFFAPLTTTPERTTHLHSDEELHRLCTLSPARESWSNRRHFFIYGLKLSKMIESFASSFVAGCVAFAACLHRQWFCRVPAHTLATAICKFGFALAPRHGQSLSPPHHRLAAIYFLLNSLWRFSLMIGIVLGACTLHYTCAPGWHNSFAIRPLLTTFALTSRAVQFLNIIRPYLSLYHSYPPLVRSHEDEN